MSQPRLLVLGTNNKKKGIELHDLLAPLGFDLKTLADYPDAIDVVEDGETFRDNARLKACRQAVHLKQWVIGEDSGISVDRLCGAPGVYSARYSGEDATDEKNNAKILAELGDLPLEKRTAHYTCYMVLSDPSGKIRAECKGICRGRLRTKPSGTGGFGYDPLFEVVEYHKTFGQLGGALKSAISHRARATRMMIPHLIKLAHCDGWE